MRACTHREEREGTGKFTVFLLEAQESFATGFGSLISKVCSRDIRGLVTHRKEMPGNALCPCHFIVDWHNRSICCSDDLQIANLWESVLGETLLDLRFYSKIFSVCLNASVFYSLLYELKSTASIVSMSLHHPLSTKRLAKASASFLSNAAWNFTTH